MRPIGMLEFASVTGVRVGKCHVVLGLALGEGARPKECNVGDTEREGE